MQIIDDYGNKWILSIPQLMMNSISWLTKVNKTWGRLKYEDKLGLNLLFLIDLRMIIEREIEFTKSQNTGRCWLSENLIYFNCFQTDVPLELILEFVWIVYLIATWKPTRDYWFEKIDRAKKNRRDSFRRRNFQTFFERMF